MTRKQTIAQQIQITVDPLADLAPVPMWMYIAGAAGRTIAHTKTAGGTMRAIAFAPELTGTGMWLLQVEFLPEGTDPVGTKPGELPCKCIASDDMKEGVIRHRAPCPIALARLPTFEEVRLAQRELLPRDMVVQTVLFPYWVKQLPNVVQCVQSGTLTRTASDTIKLA